MKIWWIYALLSAVFAALTAILAKMGVKDIDSNLATAIRTAVVLVLAWSIVFWQGTQSGIGKIPRASLFFLIASGLATGISWIFYFRALQLGPVSLVAPIDKSSLALTTLLAIVLLGEQFTWRAGLGTALVLLGTLVIAWPRR